MRKLYASELEKKEIINLCTGQRLGGICDYELDADSGQILAVIASSSEGIPFINKKEEYVIPWCRIDCIGEDTLLVKIPASEISSYVRACKKGRCKL